MRIHTRLAVLILTVSLLVPVASVRLRSAGQAATATPPAAAQAQAASALGDFLKPVKEKFAPDTRLAVFTVTAEREGQGIVLKGEVDQAAAKDAAVAAARAAGHADVVDRIQVLPDPALGDRRVGMVTVSVATMRAKPSQAAELVNEALLGTPVKILKKQGGWYYAQTDPEQYLGWMEPDQVAAMTAADVAHHKAAARAIVLAYFALIRAQADDSAQPVADLAMGDLVETGAAQGDWLPITLPDGRTGFVESKVVRDYRAWQAATHATPESLEKVARQFLGVPYLWGGTSPRGFDCSGFAKTIFRLNGIEVPRDADQQGAAGEAVSLDNDLAAVQKGDLVFFCPSPARRGSITHVGLYLGNKLFIHCSGLVKLNSFDPASPIYSENLRGRLVGARRFIKAAATH